MSESTPPLVLRSRVRVSFDYPVCFTRSAFDPENLVFRDAVSRLEPARRHRIWVIVDQGVASAWPRLARDVARYCDAHAEQLCLVEPPRVVVGGEAVKHAPELITELQHEVQRLALDRQSCCVAIGGGAVLDAVGYVAATAHRGLRMVRLPTTVLAQDDAGVGVKNGVNAFGTKNFLGTFAPPFAVVNDLDFLETLSVRDKRAGMAEAVKVALIRDPAFFEWLERSAGALSCFEHDAMAQLVRRAAELHLRHIAEGGDPFELGSARPLDFGHWAAHRLESLTEHALRHGEAVAIGMALDCRYAAVSGLMSMYALGRVYDLLHALGLPLWHEALAARDDAGELALLRGLDQFREHLGGELTVTLLRGLGDVVDVHDIDRARMGDAIRWLHARRGRVRRAPRAPELSAPAG